MAALVTLEFHFADGAATADGEAELFWVNDAGEEQRYVAFARGATVTQETFGGHHWIVRGRPSHEALLRVQAQPAPALQQHRIGEPVGDNGGGDDDHAFPLPPLPHDDTLPPTGGDNDPAIAASGDAKGSCLGRWVGAAGICRFERAPTRTAGGTAATTAPSTWVELDAHGRQAGTFVQVDALVETRWLWWAGALWAQLAAMSHEKDYIVMGALSIAGAYNVFDRVALPVWARDALGPAAAALGPNPMMSLVVLALIAGAAVAAAVPLTESTLTLRNALAGTEVRLTTTRGYSCEPERAAPGRPAPWVAVCDGEFAMMPLDLRAQQGRQAHHGVFLAATVVMLAAMTQR